LSLYPVSLLVLPVSCRAPEIGSPMLTLWYVCTLAHRRDLKSRDATLIDSDAVNSCWARANQVAESPPSPCRRISYQQ